MNIFARYRVSMTKLFVGELYTDNTNDNDNDADDDNDNDDANDT